MHYQPMGKQETKTQWTVLDSTKIWIRIQIQTKRKFHFHFSSLPLSSQLLTELSTDTFPNIESKLNFMTCYEARNKALVAKMWPTNSRSVVVWSMKLLIVQHLFSSFISFFNSASTEITSRSCSFLFGVSLNPVRLAWLAVVVLASTGRKKRECNSCMQPKFRLIGPRNEEGIKVFPPLLSCPNASPHVVISQQNTNKIDLKEFYTKWMLAATHLDICTYVNRLLSWCR